MIDGLGERLASTRRDRRMTQVQLANKLNELQGSNLTSTIISNWETGRSTPNADECVALCIVLDTKLSYLLDYYGGARELSDQQGRMLDQYEALDAHGKRAVDAVLDIEFSRCQSTALVHARMENLVRPINFIRLPVSAGTGISLDGDSTSEPIDIPLTKESRCADFVLMARGDSMEPDYSDGDLLLIKSEEPVELGQLGIFDVNGEGFFKKLGNGRLISLNRRYKPIVFGEADVVRCFGKVLGKTERV